MLGYQVKLPGLVKLDFSLAPPPQLWLPPEISFLRIASNANLGGTSGRALFPPGRFLLKYIFRINHQ